ncbi:hypothetical protein [Deinococcus sp. PESE-13]
MKKLFLLTALAGLLASCGQNSAQPQQGLNEAVPSIAAKPQTTTVKLSAAATEVYAADKVEMYNRWDYRYRNRVTQLIAKLQVTDLGYSRGEYNTEWRLWRVGYVPTQAEVQQARTWFQGQGWDVSRFVGKEQAMYALYAIKTAPDDSGTPPVVVGAGLRANPWYETVY